MAQNDKLSSWQNKVEVPPRFPKLTLPMAPPVRLMKICELVFLSVQHQKNNHHMRKARHRLVTEPGDDDLTASIVYLMRPTYLPFPYSQSELPLLLRALLLLQLCPARLLGPRYPPPCGSSKLPSCPRLIPLLSRSGIAQFLKRADGFLQTLNLFLCPASFGPQPFDHLS